ncbi:MAG: hypothetical protein Q4G52_07835 [Clostridia bacterium]|nr:hypothetical protein [Clostridia bacterium]
MNKVMKALAIAALLVTVAGACAVLYGVNMMTPQAQQVLVSATPASQAQEVFDNVQSDLENGTFTGRVYGATDNLRAEDCTFLTYTVRLANRGFFPAEWIEMTVIPSEGGGDVLQLPEDGGRVLAAGGVGDLSATLLTRADAQDERRTLEVSCYVFGKKSVFRVEAN